MTKHNGPQWTTIIPQIYALLETATNQICATIDDAGVKPLTIANETGIRWNELAPFLAGRTVLKKQDMDRFIEWMTTNGLLPDLPEQGHREPSTTANPHARRSDPITSHRAVHALANDAEAKGMTELIIEYAGIMGAEIWDDGDAAQHLEQLLDRRVNRNNVAALRGGIEHAHLERMGVVERADRVRATNHYRIKQR